MTFFYLPLGSPRWRRVRALQSLLARLAQVVLVALLCGLGVSPATAAVPTGATVQQANGPKVSTVLKPGVLRLGARAVLAITVEGSDRAQLLNLPDVDGLRLQLASGPSRQIYTEIVNGRRSTKSAVSWQIVVEADREGKYTIPPFDLEANGVRLQTEERALEVVRDLRGQELGLLRIESEAEVLIEGQPFRIDVVFGCDAGLGASIDYFDLGLPWIDGLPGVLIELARPDPRAGVEPVVLNSKQQVEAEVAGQARVGERVMNLYRLRLLVTPTRAGRIELDGSVLRFAETRMRRAVFDNRREIVEQFFATAEDLALDVRELPEEGQPIDYTGAIGRLELRASADGRDVRVGDSIKVTVDVTGPGNLEYFDAPAPELLESFRGFRSYGFTEERRSDRRRIVYDLVPVTPDVTEIPPIELPYFNPDTWRYDRLASDAIAIRVRPLEDAGRAGEDGAEEFERDLHDLIVEPIAVGGPASRAPGGATVLSAALGLALGWAALRTAARTGGRDPGSVQERRRRQALRYFERELRSSLDADSDLRAWSQFLADRTSEEPNAWIGRDVRRWATGAAPELSESSLATLQRVGRGLEAAHYGDGRRVRREELAASAAELMEDGL